MSHVQVFNGANQAITTRRNRFGGVEIQGDEGRNDLRAGLIEAGLNFDVQKRPVYLSTGEVVPEHSAIVRTDTNAVLGLVGKKYHPVQNQDAFGVFQKAFDDGLLEIEVVGSLNGGKIVWVQAKVVGDPMIVVGEDTVRPYILLANSHDGSIALRAGFTAVRLFCMNQMAAATKRGSLVSMKHTRNINLKSLRDGITAGQENLKLVVQSARHLAQHNVPNEEKLFQFTRRSFDLDPNEPSKLDEPVQELFESGIGSNYKLTRGSWWSAYNAVTEYLTHHRGRNADNRVKSLWFGDSSKVVGRALETALEMTA
jgi:phage/plasmid-like protein (TIGR03299 family)